MGDLKTRKWKHIFNLFDHKVYGAGSDPEVPHGKPNPDIYLVAAKRFPDNPDPSKVCKLWYMLNIFEIILIYLLIYLYHSA